MDRGGVAFGWAQLLTTPVRLSCPVWVGRLEEMLNPVRLTIVAASAEAAAPASAITASTPASSRMPLAEHAASPLSIRVVNVSPRPGRTTLGSQRPYGLNFSRDAPGMCLVRPRVAWLVLSCRVGGRCDRPSDGRRGPTIARSGRWGGMTLGRRGRRGVARLGR